MGVHNALVKRSLGREIERRVIEPPERRDPLGATLTVGWSAPGVPQFPQWDAGNAIDQGMLNSLYVFRCVEVIARSLAGLTFRAGPEAPELPGMSATFDRLAPLARLLGPPPYGPNPTTTARRLWAWSVAQLLVTGRLAWELELRPGSDEIIGIWPLPVRFLKPVPSRGGMRYFDKYIFSPPGHPSNQVEMATERVFYHWRPSPSDWREPISVLQAARLDVGVSVMLDRYDYAFLQNNMVPTTLVVMPKFAEPAEKRAFEDQFRATHQGFDKAGSTVFVEYEEDEQSMGTGGPPNPSIHVERLAISQKDAMALELQNHKCRNIRIAFGVPMSLLGDASERTYENSDQEEENFWAHDMPDLTAELSDAVNLQVAPRIGGDVGWFDLSRVPALKPASRFAPANPADMFDREMIHRDEWRSDVGLPPWASVVVEDEPVPAPAAPEAPVATVVPIGRRSRLVGGLDGEGDDGLAGTTQPPLHLDPPVGRPPPRTAGRPGVPVRPKLERRHSTGGDHAPVVSGHIPPINHDARRAGAWHMFDRQIRALQTPMHEAFVELFGRQKIATLSRLNGKRGRQALREMRADPAGMIDPASIFDQEHWRAETVKVAKPLHAAVGGLVVSKLTERFGDFDTSTVTDWLASRTNKLAGGVTQTTFDQIVSELQSGVSQGDTLDALAERVANVFETASDARALTIARTETLGAYNGAAYQGAQTLGPDVVGGQEWLATRDARTRIEHADADGQVVPVGEPFDVGSEFLYYPGDEMGSAENTINCRCSVAYLTPDEMVGTDVERMDRNMPLEWRHAFAHLDRALGGGSK